MSDEQVEEVTEEPQIEVAPVVVEPGTVVDPEPENAEGDVIVYEEGGSWHKEEKNG